LVARDITTIADPPTSCSLCPWCYLLLRHESATPRLHKARNTAQFSENSCNLSRRKELRRAEMNHLFIYDHKRQNHRVQSGHRSRGGASYALSCSLTSRLRILGACLSARISRALRTPTRKSALAAHPCHPRLSAANFSFKAAARNYLEKRIGCQISCHKPPCMPVLAI